MVDQFLMIMIMSIVNAFQIMFFGVPTRTQATSWRYVCAYDYDYDRYAASGY